MKAPKIKTLKDYPEVITATERLHLLTQVALGFPRGEKSTLHIPDPKIPTAAWTWDQRDLCHKIMIGSSLPSHLKPLKKSGSPSAPIALKGTMLAYQHERCHALLTGRNFCEISKTLTDKKIPFQLWNSFEDLRIEFLAARTLGIKFPWHSVMTPAAPVNGHFSDQMSPVAFIIAVKQAIGEAIARDPKDERNVQNQVHGNILRKGAWSGAYYITPDNCTGNYGDAVTLLTARVCRLGLGPMDLIPIIERWLELFPFPAGRENESIPGESGAVSGVNAEAAEGTDPAEGESAGDITEVRPGSFSEDTVTSEVAAARAEIMAKEGASAAEIEKLAAPLDGTDPLSGAHYDPTAQNLNVDTTALGFTTHFIPKHKCVPAYGARSGPALPHIPDYDKSIPPRETWDITGEDSAQRLRSAFPGGKGRRFTSNATENCNIERYLSRQPEMFECRNADGGTYADIVLIIDGSASMRNKWYAYGLSITLGLLRLRDQGIIERVRLVVTGPYDVLLIAHPTEEHVAKIEPDAGSEGLWCAYIAIVEAGWIEAEKTHVIVLTDGDITDADPDKDKMHAAGVYPVGVYRGPAKAASRRVGKYFDSFIARESRDELLDDIGRLFAR